MQGGRTGGPKGREGGREDRRTQREGGREGGREGEPEVPKEGREGERTGGPKGRERGPEDPVGVPVDGVAYKSWKMTPERGPLMFFFVFFVFGPAWGRLLSLARLLVFRISDDGLGPRATETLGCAPATLETSVHLPSCLTFPKERRC